MRYKYLDVAKGITLTFILMAHSCWFPLGIDRYCTAYFVALFFVVSGYLQKDVIPDKHYICSRFRKIIIPYFAYNFLIYIIYMIWKGFDTPLDALRAAAGIVYSTHCLYFPITTENNVFFFLVQNDPTWFLTTFFCASLFFCLYLRWGRKTRNKIVIFVLFAAITQAMYWLPIFLPWGFDKAFICADFMIAGYEFRRFRIDKTVAGWKEYTGMFCVLILYKFLTDYNLGIGLSTRQYGCCGIFSVGLCLCIGFTGSVFCMWGSNFISKIPGVGTVFAMIGRESLAIMALHLIVFRIFDEVLQEWRPIDMTGSYYWYFAFVRIAVACAIIIGGKALCRRAYAWKKRKES